MLTDSFHFVYKSIFENIRCAVAEVFMIWLNDDLLPIFVYNFLKNVLFLLLPAVVSIKQSSYLDNIELVHFFFDWTFANKSVAIFFLNEGLFCPRIGRLKRRCEEDFAANLH